MVRYILATSLTTEYNLFFAFARYVVLSAVAESMINPPKTGVDGETFIFFGVVASSG